MIRRNIINLLLIAASIFYLYWNDSSQYERVVFMDVGQGDATLIQYMGLNILIDGGPGDALLYQLPKYISMSDRKIDILIITHPHADHISGILAIIGRYEIGEVWVNPVCFSSPLYKTLLYSQLPLVSVDDRSIFQYKSIKIEVIYPFASELAEQNCTNGVGKLKTYDGNVNNDSIILAVQVNKTKLLFTGDAEKEVEHKMLNEHRLQSVDILKVAHHCSDSSTTAEFVKVVKPKISVCSVGENNSYGHPSKETVNKLTKIGSKVYLTWAEKGLIISLKR